VQHGEAAPHMGATTKAVYAMAAELSSIAL